MAEVARPCDVWIREDSTNGRGLLYAALPSPESSSLWSQWRPMI